MKQTSILILYLVVSSNAFAQSEVVYTQSTTAKMMSTPSFKSDVVTQLDKGVQLNVLGRKNRWVQVQHNGKSGWISELLIAKKPPIKKISVISDHEAEDQRINVRRRASSAATAAAARGLKNDDRARSNNKDQADWNALETMERRDVNEDQAREFLQQGTSR